MTNQRAHQHGRFGEKADFIRSQPDWMSAKTIVESAAKQGLKISVNHVYNLRMIAAARRTGGARATGTLRRFAHGRSPSLERQIRDSIAEVGLQRAREIFEEIAGVLGVGDHRNQGSLVYPESAQRLHGQVVGRVLALVPSCDRGVLGPNCPVRLQNTLVGCCD